MVDIAGLDIENLIAFGLILLRMFGCIMFNPILGRNNIPSTVKIGFSMLLAMLVYVHHDVSYIKTIDTAVEYIIVGGKEFLIGFAIGTVVSFFAYVIILGGEVMDMQIGLAMSKIYDPGSNVSMSLSSTYLNIIFMFMFFYTNGHVTLIKLFLELEKTLPYGSVIFGKELAQGMIGVFCECTVLGLKLAMPVIGLQFLMEMGVGILMKNIPQINVIMINIQAKILVGLIFLVIIYPPAIAFLEGMLEKMFDSIEDMVVLMR